MTKALWLWRWEKIFWTKNPLGTRLQDMLGNVVSVNTLDKRGGISHLYRCSALIEGKAFQTGPLKRT